MPLRRKRPAKSADSAPRSSAPVEGPPSSSPHASPPPAESVPAPGPELADEVNLIVAFQQGDRAAFDQLWERYGGVVYSFILKMVNSVSDAEELAQETWLRVVRSVDSYQPRAKMLTWIIQIARNLCFDFFKRQSLRQHPSLDDDTTRTGENGQRNDLLADKTTVAPLDGLLETEQQELLTAGIARLSPKKREALTLRVFHELPYDEIAKIVGAPAGTVKYRVHEAIRDLREMLEKTPNFNG